MQDFKKQMREGGKKSIPGGKKQKQKNIICKGGDDKNHDLLLLLLSRFSRVRLLATSRTAAHQPPPSMRFSRQEFWSGLTLPSPS